ncbi:MAG: hypothetical protein A2017_07330 [Lentisphaerae bacterium GWF2_44_16]|nr:MAG: hypothetical protein A2017_07330 [Lentisphaerae bacterium GWF2_44_16]
MKTNDICEKTLADMEEGDKARIVKVGGVGAIKRRLLDMGIGRGEVLKVERYAPLKDPIQINIKGYSLALRVSEGRLIRVEEIS